MITLSIILTTVIVSSFFIIRNLVKKNETLEDFIVKQSDAINACDQRLKEIHIEMENNKMYTSLWNKIIN